MFFLSRLSQSVCNFFFQPDTRDIRLRFADSSPSRSYASEDVSVGYHFFYNEPKASSLISYIFFLCLYILNRISQLSTTEKEELEISSWLTMSG